MGILKRVSYSFWLGPRPSEHALEGGSCAAEHTEVGGIKEAPQTEPALVPLSAVVSSKWFPLVLLLSFARQGVVAVGQAEALHVQPGSSAAKLANGSFSHCWNMLLITF